jgi:myo-inositol 2-dehydrogenase / D-chiro-inositol 1-dehydrogenase
MVSVGIVGCGGMGRTHTRNLAKLPGVRIRGYADPRLEAARALQQECGGEIVAAEAERLLEDREVDLVFICTHHHLHEPLCVAAAQAGKHVFVEKPLALTIEACEAVRQAVESAGTKLMVGFQARFSPFVDTMKELVPRPMVTVGQLVDPRWADSSWANDPVEGGGNVLSQGCHLFDMMYWLNESEPVMIHAEGGNLHHPGLAINDGVVATLRYANGAIGSVINGDFGAPALAGKAFYELFGGDRTVTLARYYDKPELYGWNTGIERMTIDDLPPGLRDHGGAHGYPQMVNALIAWVADGLEPRQAAKARDGVRATALGIKAFESIRTGQAQAL